MGLTFFLFFFFFSFFQIHDYDFLFDQPEVANTLVGRSHQLFKYWFDYNVNDLLLGIALFRDMDASHEILPKL